MTEVHQPGDKSTPESADNHSHHQDFPSEPVSDNDGENPDTVPPETGETEESQASQPASPTQKKSRRSPWNTTRDRMVAAALALSCIAVALVVTATSDSRATVSESAANNPQEGPSSGFSQYRAAATAVPAAFHELWRANSPATPVPVTVKATVVTGSNGEVLGRDLNTGAIRWKYSRDLPLCTIASSANRVIAAYSKTALAGKSGCSEVTQFDPTTGRRTAQRNGDAELGTRLLSDDSTITATGHSLLTSWRDDLVKSIEYGQVPALINPDKQPRVGCTYGSVAVYTGRIGVIERCPDDSADRLTVYRSSADSGKDSDEPSVLFSTVLPGKSAQLIALTGDATAVALPDQNQLALYDFNGTQQATYPLTADPSGLKQDPIGGVVPTTVTDTAVYWYSGGTTMALAKTALTPSWTLTNTLGPGAIFAGQLLVPVEKGLAVVDPETGKTSRIITVDRGGYTGEITLRTAGAVLLEQRGDTLVALA